MLDLGCFLALEKWQVHKICYTSLNHSLALSDGANSKFILIPLCILSITFALCIITLCLLYINVIILCLLFTNVITLLLLTNVIKLCLIFITFCSAVIADQDQTGTTNKMWTTRSSIFKFYIKTTLLAFIILKRSPCLVNK